MRGTPQNSNGKKMRGTEGISICTFILRLIVVNCILIKRNIGKLGRIGSALFPVINIHPKFIYDN